MRSEVGGEHKCLRSHAVHPMKGGIHYSVLQALGGAVHVLGVKSQKLQLCMRLDAVKAKDSAEGEPRKATKASGIQG